MIRHPFDLNLLAVAVAIADARSVTRAALAMHMSQPGLSTALGRLRLQFGDPMFVRTSRGMEPTARGALVVAEARAILEAVQRRVLAVPRFDPAAQTPTEFRFAMADVAQSLFLPRLLSALRQEAPLASVRALGHEHSRLEAALESGAADLAVGYFPDLTGSALVQQRLFMHGFCCLLRTGHRCANGLSRADFGALEHVVVEAPVHSQEIGERYFARHGIHRRVRLRTTHFLTLPGILEGTDLVATVPAGLGAVLARTGRIVALPPPYALPRYQVRQHWHRRFHQDPRSRWLRALVARLFGAGSGFDP
ncbi:MAG: LysR family transcriptional regulator [Rubrivivax sp.]|nr:LysR family transcriptional regulator [Burkholderiales bacterium]MCW5635383.1 LysR family transcriptional regulator [Rubrivivax sp.]